MPKLIYVADDEKNICFLRVHIADEEHSGRIREISVKDRGDIHVDDITVF